MTTKQNTTLQWRHNERDGVWNNQRLRCRSKKTSKLRVIGLWEGNLPVTSEFPSQMASNAEMFPFNDVIMKRCEYYIGARLNPYPGYEHCLYNCSTCHYFWIACPKYINSVTTVTKKPTPNRASRCSGTWHCREISNVALTRDLNMFSPKWLSENSSDIVQWKIVHKKCTPIYMKMIWFSIFALKLWISFCSGNDPITNVSSQTKSISLYKKKLLFTQWINNMPMFICFFYLVNPNFASWHYICSYG